MSTLVASAPQPPHIVKKTSSVVSSPRAPLSSKSPTSASKHQALRNAGNDYAKTAVAKVFRDSETLDLSGSFPVFSLDELKMGRLLGKGGFGTVKEIRGFCVGEGSTRVRRSGQADAVAEDGYESRMFIAEHCIRNGGDARYAVKFLSPEIIADPAMYIQGTIDMAVETRFLSAIEHPNIVKMRATSSDPFSEKYFIVMDRLYDTLEKRLPKWGSRMKRFSGKAGRLMDRSGKKANALLAERLLVAYDLSDALLYLHNRNIIYRDIKPDNIGFDIRDDVKIFDFGLSKEITRNMEQLEDGTYKLTGMTGTIRYMAPEVGLEKTYNQKCDVYALSILLWEMMALTVPFELYTIKNYKQKVYSGAQKRPKLDDSWPRGMTLLLTRGWTGDLDSRHSMKSFSESLKKELVCVRGGNTSGLEHTRRRSTFVFRKTN